MENAGVRAEDGVHPRVCCAQAEVQVLAEQEDALVERAQPVQRRGLGEQAGARRPPDPAAALRAPRVDAVANPRRQRLRRHQRPQPHQPRAGVEVAGRLARAVGRQHRRRQDALGDARREQVGGELRERAVEQLDVWLDQRADRLLHGVQSGVRGAREPDVVRQLDDGGARRRGARRDGAPVARARIHHDHVSAGQVLLGRAQQPLHRRRGVVRHGHYRHARAVPRHGAARPLGGPVGGPVAPLGGRLERQVRETLARLVRLVPARPGAAARAQPLDQLTARQQLGQRVAGRGRVAGCEQPAAAVVDDLGGLAGGRGHDRPAARESLDHQHRERIALAAVQQAPGTPERRPRVGVGVRERHAALEVGPARALAQALALGARRRPGDGEPQPRNRLGRAPDGLQGELRTLRAEHQHLGIVGHRPFVVVGGQLESGADHREPVAEAPLRVKVEGRRLGDRRDPVSPARRGAYQPGGAALGQELCVAHQHGCARVQRQRGRGSDDRRRQVPGHEQVRPDLAQQPAHVAGVRRQVARPERPGLQRHHSQRPASGRARRAGRRDTRARRRPAARSPGGAARARIRRAGRTTLRPASA